jgi:hypothetical protein
VSALIGDINGDDLLNTQDVPNKDMLRSHIEDTFKDNELYTPTVTTVTAEPN